MAGFRLKERCPMGHNPDHEIQQLMNFFRQAGIADLDDRLFVMHTFLNTGSHPTLDELAAEVSSLRPDLDVGFVEETMQLLHRFGFARKLAFEGEPLRYEHDHVGSHHDHLVCNCCGKILEFEDPDLETLQEHIAKRYGFTLLRHRMELYGLCEACSRDRESWMTLSHAREGEKFFVDGFLGRGECRMRLLDMGLRAGDSLEVISNQAGHVVIAVNQCRYSFGRGMSEKILVRREKKGRHHSEASSCEGPPMPEHPERGAHHGYGRRKGFKKMFSPFFRHPSRRSKN